jgi:SAM-dependent methyltransferase
VDNEYTAIKNISKFSLLAYQNRLSEYNFSGINLISEVNNLEPKVVIDIGCGTNYFKGKIDNITGIDLIDHPNVDIVGPFNELNIKHNSVDVILALGSLHYGTKNNIFKNVALLTAWLKPGGYFIIRVSNLKEIDIPRTDIPIMYHWSTSMISDLEKLHNLKTVKGPFTEYITGRDFPATSWWWQKGNNDQLT